MAQIHHWTTTCFRLCTEVSNSFPPRPIIGVEPLYPTWVEASLDILLIRSPQAFSLLDFFATWHFRHLAFTLLGTFATGSYATVLCRHWQNLRSSLVFILLGNLNVYFTFLSWCLLYVRNTWAISIVCSFTSKNPPVHQREGTQW